MGNALRVVMAAVSLSGLAMGQAEAQTAARPVSIRETRTQLGASVNNPGLQQSLDWTWRRQLSTSTSRLRADAHISAGGFAAATPAAVRGGGWVEIAPVSFFVVRAGVDPSQFYGTFDSLTSFDNRSDPFDADARNARGNAKSGRTMRAYVTPSLQMRAGHFAAQSSLDLEHWSSTAAGPLFYEPTRDTLLAVDGDYLPSMSPVVLYQHSQRGGGALSFGPVHSLTRVHGNALNQIQRLGAIVVHQAAGRHLGVKQPRTTVAVTRYLDDSSKQGQWSAAVGIGFALKRR